MLKIYKDGKNILLVSDEKTVAEQIQKLYPDAYKRYEVLDFEPYPGAPVEKIPETASLFFNGKYKGLKPSDYVEQNGINGAIQLFSEKGIPDDMINEVIRVCAKAIQSDILSRKDKEIEKKDFIEFINLYMPVVKTAVKKILKAKTCGTIENYCEETSLEQIRYNYAGMCAEILKRTENALNV